MQYWKPAAENEFAGDMMPFWDGRRFHLFYLLDRDHHAEQGGLGGHQWAHASSADLLNWEHHPLALPIGKPGDTDQHGVCTGSIFEHEGVYHAFYATRIKRPDGSVFEAVCRAAGTDLIHFAKSADNPVFGAPPGLDPANHRDPHVFQHADTGTFHMLVTASQGGQGFLAHYASADMDDWQFQGPFLDLGDVPCPECPELFSWNGWWYLLLSLNGQMNYWISREPLGPWRRARRSTIEGANLAVPRTASWTDGRRLAVGFLPWRVDNRDEGAWAYAGNAVFRDLLQDADGTLTTRFVSEMMPPTAPPTIMPDVFVVNDVRTVPTPLNATMRLRIVPEAGTAEYGLLLRADARGETGYRLGFASRTGRVTLRRWPEREGLPGASVDGVPGLEHGADIVVCLKDSVLDVSVNAQHTLVERGFDLPGKNLGFWARSGTARVENLSLASIL